MNENTKELETITIDSDIKIRKIHAQHRRKWLEQERKRDFKREVKIFKKKIFQRTKKTGECYTGYCNKKTEINKITGTYKVFCEKCYEKRNKTRRNRK